MREDFLPCPPPPKKEQAGRFSYDQKLCHMTTLVEILTFRHYSRLKFRYLLLFTQTYGMQSVKVYSEHDCI